MKLLSEFCDHWERKLKLVAQEETFPLFLSPKKHKKRRTRNQRCRKKETETNPVIKYL